MKRLMIMAAGTGGHIFPGLAIADTMRSRGWEVTWLGTSHGMEHDLVPRHGIPLDTLDFSGLRGKGLKHTLTGVVRLAASFADCRRILAQRQPDVVLGMGGYVTVPGGVMARVHGIPLALVNADAALLLSNKALAPIAQQILLGFPADVGAASRKATITGNPVRKDILGLPLPAERYARRSGPLNVLVVGGSLGAQALNKTLPAAMALLPERARPRLVHQTGKQHAESVRQAYAAASVDAEVLPFIEDMCTRYAEADLVICRAGAITVSELTAAGVPSVLVPLVASTTSHQRDNAQWMEMKGAAVHLPQTEMTPQVLADLFTAANREACAAMAQAAYQVGRRNANAEIADVLERLATPQGERATAGAR